MKKKISSLLFSAVPDKDKFLSSSSGAPLFLNYYGGRFTYLDYYLSSLHHAGISKRFIVAGEYAELVHSYIETGWDEDKFPIFSFYDDSEKPKEVIFSKTVFNMLKSNLTDTVLLIKADNPAYFDIRELQEKIKKRDKIVIPVIDEQKLPVVVVEKTLFLKAMSVYLGERILVSVAIAKAFKDIFSDAKVNTVEVSGHYKKISNINNYIAAQFDAIKKIDFFNGLFANMPLHGGIGKKGETVIEKGGFIKDSFVSDRCKIKGEVNKSVIYPGVEVGYKSKIINSVLFPGVVIGDGVTLTKTVVGFSKGLPPNVKANIGHGCVIGKKKADVGSGADTILNNGYTYISGTAIIPPKMNIGANCYIGEYVSRQNFKRIKNISDGRKIINKKFEN